MGVCGMKEKETEKKREVVKKRLNKERVDINKRNGKDDDDEK